MVKSKIIKIVLLIFLVLWIVSCHSNKREKKKAELDYEESHLKMSKTVHDSLIETWNEMLKANGIPTSIYELKVIKERDIVTKKEYYAILGLTNSDSAKVMCRVLPNGSTVSFPQTDINTTAICHGSIKCDPKLSNDRWICDDGTNKESCTKNCVKILISSLNN